MIRRQNRLQVLLIEALPLEGFMDDLTSSEKIEEERILLNASVDLEENKGLNIKVRNNQLDCLSAGTEGGSWEMI